MLPQTTPAAPAQRIPTDAPALAAVETEGLCRRYGRTWALVGVDLALPAGSVVLLAGRNGSGKSTLLRVLAGSLRPDGGAVRIHGESGRDALRRHTALLSHHSFTYEPLTALQNLRIFADFLGRPSRRDALMPVLEEVGLAERADTNVHAFSAGMRKRLSLARILLQDPAVVLLDEPYGQLDPPGFRLMDRFLVRLRERGRTVVMASHLLERGADLCDRAVVLEQGRVAWEGVASEVVSVGARYAGLAGDDEEAV